jgi:D-serine deaminase-like pyridoxal phosphate-dependent protein
MLDRVAIDHQPALLCVWLRGRGLAIAPHGKTTMAPALWRELLDAGAWGITFATAWQVQCARSFGVPRIMLANSLVDPVGLSWIAGELAAHPDFEFVCWVDSVRSVQRMAAILADAAAGGGGVSTGIRRPVQVIVELGANGGRTGARTIEEGEAIAAAVAQSPHLVVAGVGGYEGALAHNRSASALSAIDGYLDSILELHRRFLDGGVYAGGQPIVTAGGSAYFDRVAERLAPAVDSATVILRSGAFQIHDDGFYRGITPMGGLIAGQPFRAAMHAWVRVISRPEPGLALFDAGKRDVPFDEGMPTVQHVVGLDDAESERILSGSTVSALNDQHGFLRLGDQVDSVETLPVGSVLRLGLSHPCTAFDKWRLIPVVDDAEGDAPTVVGLVETWF